MYDVETGEFSDYLDTEGHALSEHGQFIEVLPNGNGVIYPSGRDLVPTDYRIRRLDTWEDTEYPAQMHNFDSGRPPSATTTELLSQKSAKVGFSNGGNNGGLNAFGVGSCAISNPSGFSVCQPVTGFYLPWQCGVAQYVTRHNEDSQDCLYGDCGFNAGTINHPSAEPWRTFTGSHGYNGIDFAGSLLENEHGDPDEPILAMMAGKVVQRTADVINGNGGGSRIKILHSGDLDGDGTTEYWVSQYFHFSSFGSFTTATSNNMVVVGDTIGYEGNTNGTSGGGDIHIHVQTRFSDIGGNTYDYFWPGFNELGNNEMPEQGYIYVSQNLKGNPGNDCNRIAGFTPQTLQCGSILTTQTTANFLNLSMKVATYYSEPMDFGGTSLKSPQAGPARNCSGPEKAYRIANTAPHSEYKITVSNYGNSNLQVFGMKKTNMSTLISEMDPMRDCVGVSCTKTQFKQQCITIVFPTWSLVSLSFGFDHKTTLMAETSTLLLMSKMSLVLRLTLKLSVLALRRMNPTIPSTPQTSLPRRLSVDQTLIQKLSMPVWRFQLATSIGMQLLYHSLVKWEYCYLTPTTTLTWRLTALLSAITLVPAMNISPFATHITLVDLY